MGFFDRLIGKSSPKPKPTAPTPSETSPAEPPADQSSPEPESTEPVAPRLEAAFEQLELRNLDGAREIYEEILASSAGSRPDVLVRISGDLGSTGHISTIPELIAPRYDAERHGPATGINLLQSYLALRDSGSAQHVLDLLFALKNPEIEERLWGFSNAIAELMESQRHGTAAQEGQTHVNLVTISKPIWSYGIDTLSDLLPEKNPKAKTVAFAQLALPDRDDTDEMTKQPEDALGRLTRGLPLWLAESLYFSPQYNSLAAVGMVGQASYMTFPAPWTPENIRQLMDTSGSSIDYIVTGELREHDGDYRLNLRLWEIKGFRERKSFEAQWTPATADTALAEVHEKLRFFFECKEGPGLPYQTPTQPLAWIDTLAASLSTFLAEKKVLPREQLADLPDALVAPDTTEAAALARLTLSDRASRVGLPAADFELPESPMVAAAKAQLALN